MELHWRQDEKSFHWEHLLRFHAQFESQVDKMPGQKRNEKIIIVSHRPKAWICCDGQEAFLVNTVMNFTSQQHQSLPPTDI